MLPPDCAKSALNPFLGVPSSFRFHVVSNKGKYVRLLLKMASEMFAPHAKSTCLEVLLPKTLANVQTVVLPTFVDDLISQAVHGMRFATGEFEAGFSLELISAQSKSAC